VDLVNDFMKISSFCLHIIFCDDSLLHCLFIWLFGHIGSGLDYIYLGISQRLFPKGFRKQRRGLYLIIRFEHGRTSKKDCIGILSASFIRNFLCLWLSQMVVVEL
jgi:hypothetical protein